MNIKFCGKLGLYDMMMYRNSKTSDHAQISQSKERKKEVQAHTYKPYLQGVTMIYPSAGQIKF